MCELISVYYGCFEQQMDCYDGTAMQWQHYCYVSVEASQINGRYLLQTLFKQTAKDWNIKFHSTGPLWGEWNNWWIPLTKGQ